MTTHNESAKQDNVSRRELLKAIAATSGAIVASQVVPTQWAKPVIEAGVLPAHAQGSPADTPTPVRATPISCEDVDGVDINLALDRSFSMNPDSFQAGGEDLFGKAQSAAIAFVNQVDFTTDQVAVTAFAGSTNIVSTLSSNGDDVISDINSLDPETRFEDSGTNITRAVQTAQQLLGNSISNRQAPVLILLSDGQHNFPGTGPVAQANEAKLQGIRIITIGLGRNADQQTLRDMASQTSDYYFAPTADDLEDVYLEIADNISCVNNANWSGGKSGGVQEKTYPNSRKDGTVREEDKNRSQGSEDYEPVGEPGQ